MDSTAAHRASSSQLLWQRPQRREARGGGRRRRRAQVGQHIQRARQVARAHQQPQGLLRRGHALQQLRAHSGCQSWSAAPGGRPRPPAAAHKSRVLSTFSAPVRSPAPTSSPRISCAAATPSSSCDHTQRFQANPACPSDCPPAAAPTFQNPPNGQIHFRACVHKVAEQKCRLPDASHSPLLHTSLLILLAFCHSNCYYYSGTYLDLVKGIREVFPPPAQPPRRARRCKRLGL